MPGTRALCLLRALLDPSLTPGDADRLLAGAERCGLDPVDYLARRFGIAEASLAARAAAWAGLGFLPTLDEAILEPLVGARADRLGEKRLLGMVHAGRNAHATAPRFEHLLKAAERLEAGRTLPRPTIVVPRGVFLAALADAAAPTLLEHAQNHLTRVLPDANAAQLRTRGQRRSFVALVLGLLVAAVMAPFAGFFAVLLLAGTIIAAPAIIRLAAILTYRAEPRPPPLAEDDLPHYSVLLPLRDEAAMVPQLHAAMMGLDYPHARLDIVFVVEADCPATLAAIAAVNQDGRCRVVAVPPARPRTKPKAMNYVLPLLRPGLVVVFDAEDRPESDQLRRAAARFAADPSLTCIQAELVIDNGASGVLPALFAGEYAALFGLVLPALARWGVPLPLGGTSNHFRLDRLEAIGAWDCHNVTEDADLGVRMARIGEKVETMESMTLEEAPTTTIAWVKQRTRWFKGWMTTYIVHNRHPLRLLDELGPKGFAVFQLMVLGMILAPLLHAVFMASLLWHMLAGDFALPSERSVIAAFYCALCVLGTGAAILVNIIGLGRVGAPSGAILLQVLLPFYWLLLAFAALRALVDLLVRPDHWEKTAHVPVGAGRTAPRRPRRFAVSRPPGE